jgi:hypothetical protein
MVSSQRHTSRSRSPRDTSTRPKGVPTVDDGSTERVGLDGRAEPSPTPTCANHAALALNWRIAAVKTSADDCPHGGLALPKVTAMACPSQLMKEWLMADSDFSLCD